MSYELLKLQDEDVEKIKRDATFDPLKNRILDRLSTAKYFSIKWAIDKVKDSYLLQLNASSRDNSMQEHFAFYFKNYFIEVRSTATIHNAMCWYNFPKDLELYRANIEEFFSSALIILTGQRLGMVDGKIQFAPPFFIEDDWDPPGL